MKYTCAEKFFTLNLLTIPGEEAIHTEKRRKVSLISAVTQRVTLKMIENPYGIDISLLVTVNTPLDVFFLKHTRYLLSQWQFRSCP